METSGRSRRAFAERGHDVISCDLLGQDDEPGVGQHIVGDVMAALRHLRSNGWWPDFALFHPTCTYLTYSAEWAYSDGPYHQQVQPGTLVGAARRTARLMAIEQCQRLLGLDIARIVLENPPGAFDPFSPGFQYVQPFMFGDDASKGTHLHLVRVLPLKIPPRTEWATARLTDQEELPYVDFFGGEPGTQRWSNQSDGGQNRLTPKRRKMEIAQRNLSRTGESVC